nr:uncharacterized protein LOC106688092 isoform X4 [Halyomorpha halys]
MVQVCRPVNLQVYPETLRATLLQPPIAQQPEVQVLTMTTRELQNVLNRWWSAARPGNRVFEQANKESHTVSGVRIKEERPDEAEIQELAARMVEANKAKMAAQAAAAANPPPKPRCYPSQGILGYTSSSPRPNSRNTPTSPSPSSTPDKEKAPMDLCSQKGKFGWIMLGEEHLPYIQRADEKYCAVRMVEMKLLVKYLSYLNADIYSCTCIRSFFITESEARLLTEINIKHCEARFGREQFTTKDLVVRLEDASEFYNFLELCYTKLMNPLSPINTRCGFVRINNDSVVPYTVKNDDRYVPLFYFEGETETLKKRSTTLGAWDLAYLKFCCKVQGIRSELFANDSCQVISLADIKAYFPPGTKFDEYWPPKIVDSNLLVQNKPGRGGVAASVSTSWIKVPHGSTPPANPVVETSRLPAANPVSNGWSPAMLASPQRYQSSPMPVSTQQQRVPTNQMCYSNVTSTANTSVNRSPYMPRVVPPNVNPYYPTVSHTSGHNAMSLGSSQSSQVVPQASSLARATSANHSVSYHSYAKDDWNSAYSTAAGMSHSNQLLMNNGLMPPPHLQYGSHNNNNNSAQKFPPPLIPVNGSTPSNRYFPTSSDVIDLSSPPHSPQRSLIMNGKQTPQPAHQTSRQSQQAPQAQSPSQSQQKQVENNMGWSRLIPISDTPARQSNHFPFKMQKALVNGKMVPCINAKPYVYSELLMTVDDLLEYFFPGVSLAKCREVLQNVLQVTLYSGNLQQKTVLRENNKCKTLTEVLPLIQLKDVMQYMPQLKYVMERHMNSSGESAAKRARIS